MISLWPNVDGDELYAQYRLLHSHLQPLSQGLTQWDLQEHETSLGEGAPSYSIKKEDAEFKHCKTPNEIDDCTEACVVHFLKQYWLSA